MSDNKITAKFSSGEQEKITVGFKAYNEPPNIGSTDYTLLKNKPSINNVTLVDNVTLEELGVQPSGNYATEKQLINGLATKQDIGIYLTEETDPIYIADKPNIALKSDIPSIPTLISTFVNDSNYATQTQVMQAIASIPQFSLSIVDVLPETGAKMTLYLVPKEGTNKDIYDEYIWIEQTSSFEFLGTTAVDLTDYVKKTELTSYATKTDLASKQNKLTATGTRTLPVYYDGSSLKEVGGLRAEMVAGGFTREIYYAHHPEMSDMHIIPFIYNDFAFIDKKDGSYTVTRNDGGEIGNPHNIFDAAPSFMHSRGFTEDTVWTVDITTPKTFTYGTLLYVDFGASGFGCSYAKIEAQHSVTGEWKTVLEKSDISLSYVYCRCNSDDLGVNKFKFTFKNPFSAQQFRISTIGAISYKSAGVEETMLTLKGGEVFGDVIAPNITKLQNEVNDLKTKMSSLEIALSNLK